MSPRSFACNSCGRSKIDEPEQFYRLGTNADGSPRYRARCKACTNKQAREWQKVNPEATSAIKRRFTDRKNENVARYVPPLNRNVDLPEEWRPVVGYEGVYEVSSHGNVKRILRTRGTRMGYLRPKTMKNGYLYVTLTSNRVATTRTVHSLVAEAFLGSRREGMDICHGDGDRANPVLSNLRYGTRAENAQDRIKHGNDPNAAKTHCPKGHPYSGMNLGITVRRDNGHRFRYCKQCRREAHIGRAA